jgi:hypothetical protein
LSDGELILTTWNVGCSTIKVRKQTNKQKTITELEDSNSKCELDAKKQPLTRIPNSQPRTGKCGNSQLPLQNHSNQSLAKASW